MGDIDASTIVAIVFGLVSVVVGIMGMYIAFQQLRLSALRFVHCNVRQATRTA